MLLKEHFKASKNEMVQALFVLLAVGFTILTVDRRVVSWCGHGIGVAMAGHRQTAPQLFVPGQRALLGGLAVFEAGWIGATFLGTRRSRASLQEVPEFQVAGPVERFEPGKRYRIS